ncbi:MAG: hypothetical protein ACREBC_04655 [Pyrinomonadaceae bacterium]
MAFLTLTKPLNRLLLSLSLLTFIWSPSGFAQTIESTAQLKQRAQALMEQLKYTEALPVLEKVIAAEPNDDVMRYLLASGVCDVFQQSPQRRSYRDLYTGGDRYSRDVNQTLAGEILSPTLRRRAWVGRHRVGSRER